MRARNILGTLVALVICTMPAKALAAPDAPWWYLTPVAGWAAFDDELIYPGGALEDGPHYGARIGYQFHPAWALELGPQGRVGLTQPTFQVEPETEVFQVPRFGAALVFRVQWGWR